MKFYEKYNLKHFKEFWLKIVPKEFNERFRFKIISSVDQIKKELEMEKKKLGDKPREKVTTEEYWAFICKDKENLPYFKKKFFQEKLGNEFNIFLQECIDACIFSGEELYPNLKKKNEENNRSYVETLALNRFNWALDNPNESQDYESLFHITDFFEKFFLDSDISVLSYVPKIKKSSTVIISEDQNMGIEIGFEQTNERNYIIDIFDKDMNNLHKIIHQLNKAVLSLIDFVDITKYQYEVTINEHEHIEDGKIIVDGDPTEEYLDDIVLIRQILDDNENWLKYTLKELKEIIKRRKERMIRYENNMFNISGVLSIQSKDLKITKKGLYMKRRGF